jgi:predicted amidophosphoribosyltransferase
MRNRHFPRLCRSCDVPMARQDDTCWSCGAPWEDRAARQDAHVMHSGHAARPGARERPRIPVVL